ncbi:uncharacterized protein TrAtP1_001310 [Trichoderma atroviride]|uniref:uncharacterized protein n=1 Tax=Hypocrea atroviridis TaxID=63577 RepID=UPI00331C3EAD|nr:hypothetical protein TrAtP1_001310 [Trichoderma atroviride]
MLPINSAAACHCRSLLASSGPALAACFSHMRHQAGLAPQPTASDMHSMPASSHAQNPAGKALDELLELLEAPAFCSSSLAASAFLSRHDSGCSPSLPNPPTWSQVPT